MHIKQVEQADSCTSNIRKNTSEHQIAYLLLNLFLERGTRYERLPDEALVAAVAVAARKERLVTLVRVILPTEKPDLLRWRRRSDNRFLDADFRFLGAAEKKQ